MTCKYSLLQKNHQLDKVLIDKMHKELKRLNSKKTNNLIKKWALSLTDISLRETYQWPQAK